MITNPTGRSDTLRANDPESGFFNSIASFQTATISRIVLDMRTQGVWEFKAWTEWGGISENPTDTSVLMQTVGTGVHTGRYDMGFEPNENINYWAKSRYGHQQFWWTFDTDNPQAANTGQGLAMVKPSGTSISATDSNRQHITSPCLGLNQNTTYFIGFYYRAIEDSFNFIELNPAVLHTYVGQDRLPNSTYLRKTTSTKSKKYAQEYFYYRPHVTGTNYLVFQAVSPRFSTGIHLDDIVIMDSISAGIPNLSLKNAWVVPADNCDFHSKDTLYVEIQSSGFLPFGNPKFTIEFNGQTFYETWEDTIHPDVSLIIKLNTLLSHTGFGETEVKITISAEDNQSTDTSLTRKSLKTEPITPPYTTTFQSAQRMPWNNSELSLSELQNPTFNYWTFGGTGNNTYAQFQNGDLNTSFKPGILASPCFKLEPDENYVIVFQYRGASDYENLQVLRDTDGTPETLDVLGHIENSTTFGTKAIPFTGNGGGKERIRFLSEHRHNARGIDINSFTIKEDILAWPADAKMNGIVNPVSDTALTQVEHIIVEVSNLNRRPLVNLHVYYRIDERPYILDSIPFVDVDSTVRFTFTTRASFSVGPEPDRYREYKVVAWVDAPGDVNRSNDTARAIVKNISPVPSSIEETYKEFNLMIYPNPATTEVFIKSEKEISMLFIHDMRGRLVKEIRVNGTEYRLNTSDFLGGTYLFSIYIGDERISQRIIINQQP
jgi:hypothetical protein